MGKQGNNELWVTFSNFILGNQKEMDWLAPQREKSYVEQNAVILFEFWLYIDFHFFNMKRFLFIKTKLENWQKTFKVYWRCFFTVYLDFCTEFVPAAKCFSKILKFVDGRFRYILIYLSCSFIWNLALLLIFAPYPPTRPPRSLAFNI